MTSDDIVNELRAVDNRPDFAQIYLRHLCLRAADEIERLRSRVAELEAEAMRMEAHAKVFAARVKELKGLLGEASSAIDDRLSYLSGDPLAELAGRIDAALVRDHE